MFSLAGNPSDGRFRFDDRRQSTTCRAWATVQTPVSSFRLSAYPNPFNSTAILHLEVPHAEIVRVEVFNVLGLRARELWAGAEAEEKDIGLDGSDMASGIYFIPATDTIYHRPLASAKVVLLK